MARTIHRLTALAVERAKEPALYPDGAGLYLKVSKAKTRSWVYRYGHNGKTRYAGLGPFPTVSLAAAREAAQTCRQQIAAGLDPIEAKRAEREAQRAASAKGVTFEAFARAYVESHEASWRDPKHCQQWRNTLRTDVYPKIGAKPVGEITTDDVLSVLTSIWSAKPESAGRIRGRIETILDAARVAGHREGENVARWRGHLEHLLPRKSKLRRVKHHAALPYAELPAFMAKLRARTEIAARALEFTILTAARTAEALEAKFDEIDDGARVWTVRPERMKGGRPHRVPLSAPALVVVKEMRSIRQNEYVFAGLKPGRPLSNMSMTMLVRRLGHADITVHGMRSSFRDWVAEQRPADRDAAEAALAHVNSNETEAAYLRSDLFQRRRKLMDAWARYCASVGARKR